MTNLQIYLESALSSVISSWNEKDIYAISFLVCANETYEYDGRSNVTEFSVSYNTEKDCGGAPPLSEERWNYAFWRQNETYIIEADPTNEGMRILFDWYRENGIDNIGYEAPAFNAATVTAPVYAKRLSTFTSLFWALISLLTISQLTACSGKIPVCLKPMVFTLNVRSL